MTPRPDPTTAAGTARARARARSDVRGTPGRDSAGLPGDEPRRDRLARGVPAAPGRIGATDGAGADGAADVEGGAGVDAAAGAPRSDARRRHPPGPGNGTPRVLPAPATPDLPPGPPGRAGRPGGHAG